MIENKFEFKLIGENAELPQMSLEKLREINENLSNLDFIE